MTAQGPVTVNIRVRWESPPPDRDKLWVMFKVVDWSNQPVEPGACPQGRADPPRLLVTQGPVEYRPGGAVDLAIPHGTNRVVVVELREVSSTAGPVLHAGLSPPFNVAVTDVVPKSVEVLVRPTPCTGGEVCSVQVEGLSLLDGLPQTHVSTVPLTVKPGRGVTARVSNAPDFTDARDFSLPCPPRNGGANENVSWTLEPAGDAGAVTAGEKRTVYVRMVDRNGYESATRSVDVVLDTVAPRVAEASVDPPLVNAASVLTVRLRASERLGAVPRVYVVDQDAVAVTEVQAHAPLETPTDVFNVLSLPLGGLLPSGTYHLWADVEDRAGNSGPGLDVGTFTLDRDPPRVWDVHVEAPGFGPDETPRVRPGTTAQVCFLAEDQPGIVAPAKLDVLLGSAVAAGCTSQPGADGGFLHHCQVPIPPDDGGLEFGDFVSVRAWDVAGNPSAPASARVVLDSTAPLVSTQPFPGLLRAGDTLTYVVELSEEPDPATPPVLWVTPPSGEPGPQPLVREEGTLRFSWHWDVTPGSDGHHTVEAEVGDRLGNLARRPGTGFDVDATLPALGDWSVRSVTGITRNLVPLLGLSTLGGREGDFEATGTVTGDAQVVTAQLGNRSLGPCELVGERFTCRGSINQDDSNGGTDTGTLVLVTARDAVGNQVTESRPVLIDRRPPALNAVEVTYVPSEDNPLPEVFAAGPGTKVRFYVASDEPVDQGSVRVNIRSQGGQALEVAPWQRASDRWDERKFAFQFVATGTEEVGSWTVEVEFTDLVGLTGTPVTPVTVRFLNWPRTDGGVSTLEPALDQEKLVLVRAPWGCAESNGRGTVLRLVATCDGGALCDTPHISDDTLNAPGALDAGVPMRLARVYARPQPYDPDKFDPLQELLLGKLERSPDGRGWVPGNLSSVETTGAVLTLVDEAGNESRPVAVEHTEWVATMGQTGVANPHRVQAVLVTEPTLDPSPEVVGDHDERRLAERDGVTETVTSAIPWRSLPLSDVTGQAQFDHGAYFDPARGRMVVFGGYGGDQHVREWDGAVWHYLPNYQAASVRQGTRMVYDTRRGRGLMFGGSRDGVPSNELWEWDGRTWTLREPREGSPTPLPREGHVMAHDPVTGVTYVWGGGHLASLATFDDMWAWDGDTWRQVTVTGPRPSGRMQASAAIHVHGRKLVVFGGVRFQYSLPPIQELDETWVWDLDQGGWTLVASEAKPAARLGAAMTYDPVGREVVLFGGCAKIVVFDEHRNRLPQPYCWEDPNGGDGATMNDLWSWTPSGGWVRRVEHRFVANETAARPRPRAFSSMVYDTVAGHAVVFGGVSDGETSTFFGNAWAWKDGTLRLLRPSSRRPQALRRQVIGMNPDTGHLLVFGGAPSRVPGVTVHSNETWEWDGYTWSPWQGAVIPYPRNESTLTYNPRDKVMLMFGGNRSGPVPRFGDDLWTWAGWDAGWSAVYPPDVPPSPGPAGRYNYAAAYDPVRGSLLVHGGYRRVDDLSESGHLPCGDPDRLNDTWTWHDATWRPERRDGGPPGTTTWNSPPQGRKAATAAWCDACQGVLVYGGQLDDDCDGGVVRLGETWRWDGTSWHQYPAMDAEGDGGPMPMVPGARKNALMVEDSNRRTVYLFGGQLKNSTLANDLWEFQADQGRWYPVPSTPNRLSGRVFPGGGYIPSRELLVIYGGEAADPLNDLWTADLRNGHRPAVQWDVSALAAGFTAGQVVRVQVTTRAWGHRPEGSEGSDGVALMAWSGAEAGSRGDGWLEVKRQEGEGMQDVTWVSGSAPEARQVVRGGDMRMSFQVRPVSGSTAPSKQPTVVADDMEARVRYRLPAQDP
jgi:hypothetical protein